MRVTNRLVLTAIAALSMAAWSPMASAKKNVVVHGSVQSDILVPEYDQKIGTEEYSDKILTNTYADVALYHPNVDAGVRFEYLEHPIPGFADDFKGWGVPHIFVTGKYKNIELTGGDFYEQFGNGFILRTYEQRTLGIDNAIRGGRLKVNALPGVRFTALGGVQRRYWNWSTHSTLFGGNLEWDMQEHIKSLASHGINWTVGASYVYKHEDDTEIIVPGTNNRLNLPLGVSAFDVRTQFNKAGFGLLAEYAWKGQDPSFKNGYTYSHGSAMMLSATYSKKGLGISLQAKRSDNMDFRSRRNDDDASYINNMPPFAYEHTYSLAAMYPYATQAAPGEWAFQGSISYRANRGTALGGKYGSKFTLNASHIRGIDRNPADLIDQSLMGTDWWANNWGKIGDAYYTDINLQFDKRLSRDFQLNAMYMYQQYNKDVIEGHGGMVKSHIFVAEGKYKINKRNSLRFEAQYLTTCDDQKDWLFGLVEYSWAPYLMFTASDMWNCGDTKLHYYLFSVTGIYRNNRLLIGYGRTRAGYNCAGGVCRYIPATRGLQISYSYNF